MSNRKIIILLSLAAVVHCCLILIFSYRHDWDQAFSFFAVDYRSWIVDGTPPLWSYQMCGGVTRVGDPQSFGLSPLFLITLLTGPVLGAKFTLLFSMFVALYFGAKLIRFASAGKLTTAESAALSVLFCSGNFFLQHAAEGHITISSVYLSLPIIYYSLRGLAVKLKHSEIAAAALFGWALYSSGAYLAVVYLLIPLAAAILLAAGLNLAVGRRLIAPINQLVRIFLFHLIAIFLSSYKLIHLISYQHFFPRTVDEAEPVTGIGVFLLQLFAPYSRGKYLDIFAFGSNFGPAETTVFAASSLLGIALLFLLFKGVFTNLRSPFILTSLSLVVISTALSFGPFGSFSPFALLNHFVFSDSIRVAPRFQIGIVLGLFLLSGVLIPCIRESLRSLSLVGLLLIAESNLWTLNKFMHPEEILAIAQISARANGRMQLVSNETIIKGENTAMYPLIAEGLAVLNCYDPINRSSALGNNNPFTQAEALSGFGPGRGFFIEDFAAELPKDCRLNSYFTQSRIEISPACPKPLCLRLQDENIYGKSLRFLTDPEKQRLCD